MGVKCISCNKELLSILDDCLCFRKKPKWRVFGKKEKKLLDDWNNFIEDKKEMIINN